MKLSSITIIGMHKVKNKTYDLSNFNYLYGVNGAGKSTVMQAVQLALLGYIPGTDKNKTAIFRHSNGNVMSVTLSFDNGTQISRSWTKTAKDIKATTIPENIDTTALISDLELPIFNFSDFTGMTANKLKDWFINFLPTSDSKVDWETELVNAVVPLTTDFTAVKITAKYINDTYGSFNAIEQVRKFNEECKSRISIKKADVARIQSTIQELVHYDDSDITLNKEDINRQISETELFLEKVKGKLYKYAQNQKIKQLIDSVSDVVGEYPDREDNPEYRQIKAEIAKLQERFANFTVERNNTNSEIGMLTASKRMKQEVIDKHGICPYTNESCQSVKLMIDQYIEEVKQVDDKLNNKYFPILQDIEIQTKAINAKCSELTAKLNAMDSAYLTYTTNSALYDPELAAVSEEELNAKKAEFEFTLQNLRQQNAELLANEKYDALMGVLTKDKVKAELELECFKAWEKLTSVNGLQSKLMNAPFIAFGEKITTYLQMFYANMRVYAEFVLGEKANSFSFGMVRDGKYVDYDLLSSGEKCLYTLALSIAIAESSSSQVKMLLVDDLLDHLDPSNIRNCFSTLYNITSVQILIAGVQPYIGENADSIVIEIGEK